MAQKTVTTTTIIDDLDGKPVDEGKAETINFTFDAVAYEIDLSDVNAKKLRDALKPYLAVARKTGRGTATRTSASKNDPAELAAAREWLRSNGETVSDRGRIAAPLMEKYRANK
ncbi:Lsr2 family protein [Cryobacterium sp. 10S3]|uniref:histone-like nucleoid-structuring protein Lsr2 n=1 Tax=Cryobacterium sp. 10S3 TaxID=3048582 RepID=UPI002AC8C8F2|nr:Lsr2 family protein [Cryobacterium sp. 10S3]MEB0288774.1 Lsr2 family protein [Cryobacterium sp. 10S3]WPX14204.1 Lsr2 family protein [Cryobacterium sp. 10S3]